MPLCKATFDKIPKEKRDRILNVAIKEFADNSMKNGIMKSPFITVNSWNEWTETSYLEPDDLYGYGYLEAIKDVFGEK